jgi:hypothetical protein
MDTVNVHEVVERLGSEQDAMRKKAAFGLQSFIGDPSFAEQFIAEGGLVNLRLLVLRASGNTLAYSLASLAKLLEVDKGWDYVDQELVERVRNFFFSFLCKVEGGERTKEEFLYFKRIEWWNAESPFLSVCSRSSNWSSRSRWSTSCAEPCRFWWPSCPIRKHRHRHRRRCCRRRRLRHQQHRRSWRQMCPKTPLRRKRRWASRR